MRRRRATADGDRNGHHPRHLAAAGQDARQRARHRRRARPRRPRGTGRTWPWRCCGQPGGRGKPHGRALRRGGGRLRLRRVGGGLPARPGRPVRAGPRARPELPAGLVPAQPPRAGRQPVGAVVRAVRDVRHLGVPRHRVRGVQRSRRRLAHLRQRHAPQGPGLVRRRRARPAAPAMAGQLRRPRAVLRGRRGHDGRAALPVRRGAVLGDTPRPGRCATPPRRSAWTGGCRRSRSASPARASPRSPGSRSPRSTRTCTASRASPAGCAASATSAATTARRTPSTTPTCPGRPTPGR